MSLRARDTLDHRYTLVERLGRGGQGSVWKAFDRNTGEARALKIVDLRDHDREAAERARREADLVKNAKHPALVTCHSLFQIPSDDVLVLVFDFVSAAPLKEALSDPRFGRAHRFAALRHIAGALAHLHRIGVVHRDLKPDNVLLTPRFWEDPAAPSGLKLIDFGIAAPRRGPDGATISGMFGTTPYMAPELFAMADLEAQRSPARDVFAFGVLGWEMLDDCHRHPTGLMHSAGAGAYRASYEAFRLGRELWPLHSLEGPWSSIVAACLALDPKARPHDGSAILSLLDGTSSAPSLVRSDVRSAAPASTPSLVRSDVTDPHVAPGDSTPARTEGGMRASSPPAVSTVKSAPLPVALRTEIAPASSLPKAPAVDRTTPLVPEVETSPPARASTKDGGMAASERRDPRSDSAPSGRSKAAVAQAPGRSPRIKVALALIFSAAVFGAAAWALLGPPPSSIYSPPPSSTRSPPRSDSIASATATSSPSAAPTASASIATSSPSATEQAETIKVCCGDKKMCSSTWQCDPKPDCNRKALVPRGQAFLLRVFKVHELGSNESQNRDLAKEDDYEDVTLCVQTRPENKVCTRLKETPIPRADTAHKLRIQTSDIVGGLVQVRLERKGQKLVDFQTRQQTQLLTNALCGTLRLKSSDDRYSLTFYLDDPTPPPTGKQAP